MLNVRDAFRVANLPPLLETNYGRMRDKGELSVQVSCETVFSKVLIIKLQQFGKVPHNSAPLTSQPHLQNPGSCSPEC